MIAKLDQAFAPDRSRHNDLRALNPLFMKIRFFLPAFAVLLCSVLGADVSGTWKAEFDTQIGLQKYTYTLKLSWMKGSRRIERMAVAVLRAGEVTEIDLRPTSKDDASSRIIFVPTPEKLVERMLGTKRGTGGSEGVGYLKTTLDKKFFPELWEARTHLDSRHGAGGCPFAGNA